MTGRYAQGTDVPVERSIAEIERTLQRYGATGFLYGWHEDHAVLAFMAAGRQIRFRVTMPAASDKRFTHTPQTGKARSAASATEAYQAARRQRWRALLLLIKAKLEAIESGISTIESEFLANVVLPDGQLAGEWLAPQIEETYRTGTMPPLLPGPSG